MALHPPALSTALLVKNGVASVRTVALAVLCWAVAAMGTIVPAADSTDASAGPFQVHPIGLDPANPLPQFIARDGTTVAVGHQGTAAAGTLDLQLWAGDNQLFSQGPSPYGAAHLPHWLCRA